MLTLIYNWNGREWVGFGGGEWEVGVGVGGWGVFGGAWGRCVSAETSHLVRRSRERERPSVPESVVNI